MGTSYIMLSLVLGTIIDNYGQTKAASERAINDNHFFEFKAAWTHYDPDGDSMIPESDLIEVIKKTPYPLGIKGQDVADGDSERKMPNRLIQKCHIQIIQGEVSFPEVPSELQDELDQERKNALGKVKKVKRMPTDGADGAIGAQYNVSQSKGISLVQSAMHGYI